MDNDRKDTVIEPGEERARVEIIPSPNRGSLSAPPQEPDWIVIGCIKNAASDAIANTPPQVPATKR